MPDTQKKQPSEIDQARGIQNTEERFHTQAQDRLLQQQLLNETGVERRRSGAAQNAQVVARTTAEEEQLAQFQEEAQIQQQIAVAKQQMALRVAENAAKVKKVRGMGSFARFSGLGIAVTSYMWQFAFSLFSLFVLFGYSSLDSGGLLGSVVSWIGETVGLTDMVLAVFMLLWCLGALLVITTFLGFLLWFMMLGIKPFSTTMGMFTTILALVFSVVPILNLGPWIAIWVFYMSLSSLFSGNE